jgi:hypothetical protein
MMVRLEQMEQRFTEADDGGTDEQHVIYARLTNTLHRVLMTLGIKRTAKDITPDLKDYVAAKRHKRHVTLDHEDD